MFQLFLIGQFEGELKDWPSSHFIKMEGYWKVYQLVVYKCKIQHPTFQSSKIQEKRGDNTLN